MSWSPGWFRAWRESHPAVGGLFLLWPLLLPVILVLPGLLEFPYPGPEARYSDLVITHYPNLLFLKHALTGWRSLPLWSPLLFSGYPFFADPLSSLWYPPAWIALWLPLPLGFNLLVILHLVFGGLGMYRLLRAQGLGPRAALFSGMCFAALPKLFAHYGAGHLTLVYAVPWTPWLFLTSIRPQPLGLRPQRVKTFNPMSAVILALVILADVRWGAYAAAGWLFFEIASLHPFYGWSRVTRAEIRLALASWARLASAGLIAGMLASPLLLPLLEYTRLSTRSQMAAQDVFEYSLPFSRLLGLVFPVLSGFHEWVMYPGLLVLFLAMLALIWKSTRRSAALWFWIAGISLLLSLGSNLPILTFTASLPGLNLWRVPPRALFLFGMALAAAAGFAVERLEQGISATEKRAASIGLVGLAAFILLLSIVFGKLSAQASAGFAWAATIALGGAILLIRGLSGWLPSKLWYLCLCALCLFDLARVDSSLVSYRSAQRVTSEAGAVVDYLASQEGLFRIYSPSYSLPQQASARAGLELAGGVNPLYLAQYADYFSLASGVPLSAYSVTLPPYPDGDTGIANSSYEPDAARLGALNVRYVVADFELPNPQLILRQTFGQTRVYENSLFLPRAWLRSPNVPGSHNIRPAQISLWSPNRISLQAEGPGELVLSEVSYPGWIARVDGIRVQIQTYEGILRSIQLGEGIHRVEFLLLPASLYLGLVLFGIAAGLCLLSANRQRKP